MRMIYLLLGLSLISIISCARHSKVVKVKQSTEVKMREVIPLEQDKVYNGDVMLYTQKDIDEFGQQGYTFIQGDLKIESPSDDYSKEIVDTKPLTSLRIVNGDVMITRFRYLVGIQGLQNLEQVNGDFTVSGCGLETIHSFHKLSTIGGSLTIAANTGDYGQGGLSEISGFDNLTEVKNIYISGNSSLRRLDAFNNLQQTNTVQIMSAKMSEITNFKNLKTVQQNFTIEYVSALKKIALDKLETVNGFFALNENRSINGHIYLPALRRINHLYFMSNENFDNYCDLAEAIRLQKIDTLSTEGNKLNLTKEEILIRCQ